MFKRIFCSILGILIIVGGGTLSMAINNSTI